MSRRVPVGNIKIVSCLSSVASTASCCKALKLLICQCWYSKLSNRAIRLSDAVAIAKVSVCCAISVLSRVLVWNAVLDRTIRLVQLALARSVTADSLQEIMAVRLR